MPSKEQKRQSARKEKLREVAAAKKAAKEAALQAATASQSPEPGKKLCFYVPSERLLT